MSRLSGTKIGSVILCATALYASLASPAAPSYEDIKRLQALGRVVPSPDGTFFLYEWMRPYNWDRDTRGEPVAVAKRMQTWMYKVDVDISPATSQYVFHPGSGSSYWLGRLSPDLSKVSFYSFDDDYNALQAGVWDMVNSKLTMFEPVPDGARLEIRPQWISNEELVYPGKNKSVVKASVKTGEARPCADCTLTAGPAPAVAVKPGPQPVPVSNGGEPVKLDPDLKVLAKSPAADLTVYVKDTVDMLGLYFSKGNAGTETVFENSRKPERMNRADGRGQ